MEQLAAAAAAEDFEEPRTLHLILTEFVATQQIAWLPAFVKDQCPGLFSAQRHGMCRYFRRVLREPPAAEHEALFARGGG